MRNNIIYIGGYGRSGSTILGLLLGQLDNFYLVGEIGVFHVALKDRRPCTCGSELSKCNFWSSYLNHDGDAKYAKKSSPIEKYVLEESAADCIVDTTKTSWYNAKRPFLLSKRGNKVFFIHLYRPLKYVMKSAKKGMNTDLENNINRKTKFVILRTTLGWLLANFIAWLYQLYFGKNSAFINFNELQKDPKKALDALVCLTKDEAEFLYNLINEQKELKTSHEINGNRFLRQKGPIKFKVKK